MIVEKVGELTSGEVGRVHCLPHHAVIRRDKETKRQRDKETKRQRDKETKNSELSMMRPVSQTKSPWMIVHTPGQHFRRISWTSP